MKNSYLPIIMEGAGVYLQYEFPFFDFRGDFEKLNHGMMGEMVRATWLGWWQLTYFFMYTPKIWKSDPI